MSSKRSALVSAAVLAAAGIGLVFFLGRGIEQRRDAAWQDAAGRLRGTFRSSPACGALDDRFGRPAPWAQWASDGELRCLRLIEGQDGRGAWSLVQVRYSVRERRGEEHPDSWYEVTVAAMRRPVASGAPGAIAAREGYAAAQNDTSVFVWKRGSPGAGASLEAGDLPALLEEARRLAGR